MRTDPSERVLYVWGRWVWYYRLIALVVYATGLLLVGFYRPARDLLRNPSIGNVLLLALIALLVGVWLLVVWVTWRDGQSRVTRIVLSPEGGEVVVRTLNFCSRRIPLAALEDFRYHDLRPDPGEYVEPTLTVQVRGGLPLKIDLEGRILDEQTFKTIFRYRPTNPGAAQRKERKKRA